MYELLKQYERVGKRTFELEELKQILKTEEKYQLYGDFKRYVLKRAKKDLEKFTDISFKREEKKRGRKVSQLVFHIAKRKVKV